MAAISSSGTGNWNSTGTWTGSVIPVSGDTVTIGSGHTVTIPVGYTAVCGTSPSNDSGTAALTADSSGNGTGILVINGTFKYQGPVRQGDATWTVGAGGTITYDASGAGTPSTALYTWQLGQNNGLTNCKLVFNGSSGSRCTVNSISNVQSGGFGNQTTNWQGGGRIEAAFTDFSYHGPATTSGSFLKSNLNGSSAKVIFDDCTFDHCAQLESTGPFSTTAGIDPASTVRLRRTKITNPANTDFSVQVNIGTRAISGGERLIEFSDIAGRIYFGTGDGGGVVGEPTGFTIQHNIFRVTSLTGSSSGMNPVELNGGSCAVWKQNLVFISTGSANPTTQDPNIKIGQGTYTNTYVFRLTVVGANSANMHPLYVNHLKGDTTISGWIFQMTVVDTGGDIINFTNDPTVDRAMSVTNNLYLPNAAGDVPGSLMLQQGAVTQDNDKWTFDHNTVACGATIGSSALGVSAENGATWPSATVPSIRSNLLWRSTSGTGTIANSHASATVNADAVTAADYNWTYNVTGSIYGNPTNQFAGSEGAHDGSGNPSFVDSTRSLLTFDQGYSGASVGTAWATSTSYSVGDIRSNSNSSFFGSQVHNWRCIQAHTSGSTSEPAAGGTYPQFWEPACIKTISDDLIAGTTYSGGTNSLVGELVAWVKAGYAPRNASLKNAGHDSVTIGAVEGLFGGIFPHLTDNALSGGFSNMGL